MSHFAEINENGIVVRVIVAEQDFINSGAVGDPANWIQTSYNTFGGWHPQGTPLRKNYAGIGYVYNSLIDGFVPPKPHDSAIIVQETGLWTFPPLPEVGTPLALNSAWLFSDDSGTIIVSVIQAHIRTEHNPRIVPALFSILQFGEDLNWIAEEYISAGSMRRYNNVLYTCIQAHTTQVGWEPPNVPALWTLEQSSVWIAGASYVVNQKITYLIDGLQYVCLQSHTSLIGWEPPNAPSLWQIFIDSTDWAPNVIYNIQQVIEYQGVSYKCLQFHKSQTGWEPPNVPALWALLNVSGGSQWQSGFFYSVNDEVYYNNLVYRCVQSHTSLMGWEPPNVPALWQLVS